MQIQLGSIVDRLSKQEEQIKTIKSKFLGDKQRQKVDQLVKNSSEFHHNDWLPFLIFLNNQRYSNMKSSSIKYTVNFIAADKLSSSSR